MIYSHVGNKCRSEVESDYNHHNLWTPQAKRDLGGVIPIRIYFPSSHLKARQKNKISSRSCIDAQNVITKMYRVMESEGMFTKLSHNHRMDVKHSPAARVSPSRDTYFSWCRADLRMNHRKKLIKTVQPDHFILLPSGLSIKIAKSCDFFMKRCMFFSEDEQNRKKSG